MFPLGLVLGRHVAQHQDDSARISHDGSSAQGDPSVPPVWRGRHPDLAEVDRAPRRQYPRDRVVRWRSALGEHLPEAPADGPPGRPCREPFRRLVGESDSPVASGGDDAVGDRSQRRLEEAALGEEPRLPFPQLARGIVERQRQLRDLGGCESQLHRLALVRSEPARELREAADRRDRRPQQDQQQEGRREAPQDGERSGTRGGDALSGVEGVEPVDEPDPAELLGRGDRLPDHHRGRRGLHGRRGPAGRLEPLGHRRDARGHGGGRAHDLGDADAIRLDDRDPLHLRVPGQAQEQLVDCGEVADEHVVNRAVRRVAGRGHRGARRQVEQAALLLPVGDVAVARHRRGYRRRNGECDAGVEGERGEGPVHRSRPAGLSVEAPPSMRSRGA